MRYLLGPYEYWKRKEQYKGREREELGAKLTIPFWPERMWDCRGYETLSGWRFNFQTYRILPRASPFFNAVESGDINLVRAMLANREVSVTDRFPNGLWEQTALHKAAGNGDVDMCRLLLMEGADPLACDDQNETPLHKAASLAAYNTFHKRNQPWETARLLISKGASDALIDDVAVIKSFNGPRSMFHFLQQHMYPPYREVPPQTRFDIAACIGESWWHNTPAILSSVLQVEAGFDKELLTSTNSWGYTLLHLLVIGFVETNSVWSRLERQLDDSLSSEELEYMTTTNIHSLSWRPLIRKVTAAGADLSALDAWGRPPLCLLIHRYSVFMPDVFMPERKPQWDLLHLLKSWLEDIFDAGIDLLQYGTLESLAVQKRRDEEPAPECACSKYSGSRFGPRQCTHTNKCRSQTNLISLHYSTRPGDWIFWLSEHTDEFAGDFWSMIEDPLEFEAEELPMVFTMPGSWNEAEDNSSDEE